MSLQDQWRQWVQIVRSVPLAPAQLRRSLRKASDKRGSMHLKQQGRRPSQESLVSLMSCSSAASYVNYKPCCHQVRHRHKSPSSVAGSSSRSSVTDFSYDGRHKAYRRSTRQLCVKTEGTPAVVSLRNGALMKDVSPMTFELPVFDSDDLFFVSRGWLFYELSEILVHPACDNGMIGAVIVGAPGTGKTTVIHQLAACSPAQQPVRWASGATPSAPYDSPSQVSNSHFSASSDSGFLSVNSKPNVVGGRPGGQMTAASPVNRIRDVADAVVAYHFCQIGSEATCSLPMFLHNLTSMIALNPRVSAYADTLARDDRLKELFSVTKFYEDPVETFRQLVTEPLKRLQSRGKLSPGERDVVNLLILVDALDEAEFHRPDSCDSIGSFLVNHAASLLPPGIRLVLTCRSGHVELLKGLPLYKIDLDQAADDRLYRDSFEYVSRRVDSCLAIQSNIVSKTASSMDSGACPLTRFAEHLASIGRGSFLYMRLVLDLIQQNYVIVKGASYRVLPINLSEAFNLMLSLRFSTEWSFRPMAGIFEAMLAALRPLTSEQLFAVLNAGLHQDSLSWDDFQERLNQLQEFIVKTQNGTFVFFHPMFREWLMHRDSSKNCRFLISIKNGHASIALWLTRRCQERSLNADDMVELGHHLLKAHVFKLAKLPPPGRQYPSGNDCQLSWLLHSAYDIRTSLCSLSNIFQPNTKVSKLLLLAGASANASTPYYNDAPLLCVAARQGLYNFAMLLLEFNANVNATDQQLRSPLIHAAIGGHLDLIQMLHEHDAQISQIDKHSKCALVHAAEQGHVDVVSFLLQCDWSPQSKQNYPLKARQQVIQQAFVAAAKASKIPMCAFLFDFYDVDVNAIDPVSCETALSVASSCGNKETVLYLLECRAAVNLGRSSKPTPPLLMAVKNGCWEVVSALLVAGVDVNGEMDDEGKTALMYAAESGHIGVMELLLGRDANVNLVDDSNRNALAWSCIGNQESCASLLLERDCRVLEPDKQGNLPVHFAAQYGSKALLLLFLERRVSIERSNNRGLRPIEVAIEAKNFDTFQCLLRRGAKLGPQTWTQAYKNSKMTLLLLEKLLEDGYVLYRRGKLTEAAHRFQYALRKLPDHVLTSEADQRHSNRLKEIKYNMLLGMARCKRRDGEHEEAIEQASLAVQFDPDRYEAYFVRARCQCDRKSWVAAQSDFLKAQRLCPDNKEIENSLDRLKKILRDPGCGPGEEKNKRLCRTPEGMSTGQLDSVVKTANRADDSALQYDHLKVDTDGGLAIAQPNDSQVTKRSFYQTKWKNALRKSSGVETEL